MDVTGIPVLLPDNGLNGGGWHIHANGGKLNPHLDYSMHPKLPYQRKIILLSTYSRIGTPIGEAIWAYEHNDDSNGLDHWCTKLNLCLIVRYFLIPPKYMVCRKATPQWNLQKKYGCLLFNLPPKAWTNGAKPYLLPLTIKNLIKRSLT